MRALFLACLTIALGAICAAPASACQVPITPPMPFWPEAPSSSDIAPDETVLEVVFGRDAQPYDPGTSTVLRSMCGPDRVLKITRVVAGDAQEQKEVLLDSQSVFPAGQPRLVLVGKIAAPLELNPFYWPDIDSSLRFFEPRLPPQ
ncbi:MAG: hypothetical protein Q8R02_07780 [Hyphomonadaceae bacterium]|nr:hypothetical protein [Hyphomonadaceae bacterium]